MSRNLSRAAAESVRKKRRRNSILLSLAAIVVIVVLLVTEQVAILYLLATLGVAALLIVVAFADLHGAQTAAATVEPVPADDSAAIASGIARPTPSTSFGATRPRAPKRRHKR
jgi:hypothetical protein